MNIFCLKKKEWKKGALITHTTEGKKRNNREDEKKNAQWLTRPGAVEVLRGYAPKNAATEEGREEWKQNNKPRVGRVLGKENNKPRVERKRKTNKR